MHVTQVGERYWMFVKNDKAKLMIYFTIIQWATVTIKFSYYILLFYYMYPHLFVWNEKNAFSRQ